MNLRNAARAVVLSLLAGCGSSQAAPATSEMATSGPGVSSGSPAPAMTPEAYRAELQSRRTETIDRCTVTLNRLVAQRQDMGNVGTQVATNTVLSAVAGAASVAQANATGAPAIPPAPSGGGADVTRAVRLDGDIARLRRDLQSLADAQADVDVVDGIDRLRHRCP